MYLTKFMGCNENSAWREICSMSAYIKKEERLKSVL